MARPRNKRPVSVEIYQSDYDHLWHGYITVGVKPNGKPDRRHRTGKTRDECEAKVRELEDEIAAKKLAPAGRAPTVEQYLTGWLAGLRHRYKTMEDYRRVVTTQLIPLLGGHRLTDDGLRPEHVRNMMETVEANLSASAAHRAHRILRSALSDAVREELLTRNVAKLVRPPTVEEKEIEPLTVKEVRAVLGQIYQLPRNQARWLLALTYGMRQGETLALARHRPDQPRLPGDIDLEAATLTVREKQLRHRWLHGCADPARCARWMHGCATSKRCDRDAWQCPSRTVRCRTKACPPQWRHGCDVEPCGKSLAYVCPARVKVRTCKRHLGAGGCPELCPPGCTGHARTCPQRRGGGLVKEPPKSNAGKRTLVLPPPIIDALRRDEAQQQADRELAANLWRDSGLWFTGPLGQPIDPRADYQQWQDMLAAARVAPARLHDARHTAATFLLVLGVDNRTVMDMLGWSQESMLDRYQHVVDELRKEAASRIEQLWWPAPPGPGSDPGTATDHATAPDQGRRRGYLHAV